MTYEEAIKWLRARGGSVTTKDLAEGGEVIATVHRLTASVIAPRLSDRSDVRRCEIEAIMELRQLLEA